MNGFAQYLIRRFAASLVAMLGVSVIVFLMVRVLPGDPARVIAGLLASEEEVARIRVQLGLDKPLHVQYIHFLGQLLRGNLGYSARTSDPVMKEIMHRLPATALLAVVSSVLAGILGVAAGTLAATHSHSFVDYLISTIVLFGISMPVYWLGIMLIVVFAIWLQWLPAAGAEGPTSIILPSLTLASFSTALVARMTRSSMLEVLRRDYMLTARAKGLREGVVIYRHAVRNALIPVITVVGLQFGNLLGGAVLTESVFGWPGMGLLLVESIFSRDYPMVQGIVLVFAFLVALVNLGVDLLYALVDPRIRYG